MSLERNGKRIMEILRIDKANWNKAHDKWSYLKKWADNLDVYADDEMEEFANFLTRCCGYCKFLGAKLGINPYDEEGVRERCSHCSLQAKTICGHYGNDIETAFGDLENEFEDGIDGLLPDIKTIQYLTLRILNAIKDDGREWGYLE